MRTNLVAAAAASGVATLKSERGPAPEPRLQELSRHSPWAYRAAVLFLALAGYAFLLNAVAVSLSLVLLLLSFCLSQGKGELQALKIGVPLLGMAGLILKGLAVRLVPPSGLRLAPGEAPRLFGLLEELRGRARAPRIHVVLLSEEFNASVSQIPRLWIFWPRNYLVLGWPLLAALSPEQFRAVLLHELGHLSRQHGRFGAWIYRVRRTWKEVLASLEEGVSVLGTRFAVWGTGLIRRFFEWYAPYFEACSLALARSHEFEADRLAAEVEGVHTLAEALVRVEAVGQLLDGVFWRSIFALAREQPEPPEDVFARLGGFVGQPGSSYGEAGGSAVRQALLKPAAALDAHPSLMERLQALNDPLAREAALPDASGPSAAEALLGDISGRWAAQMSLAWRGRSQEAWSREYAETQLHVARARELQDKALRGALTEEEAFERACALVNSGGFEEARPLLEDILQKRPGHPGASLILGARLLSEGDPAGLSRLEAAAAGDSDLADTALEQIMGYWERRGDAAEAEKARGRLAKHQRLLALAKAERSIEAPLKPLLPHGRSPMDLEPLLKVLRATPEIRKAYLARKEVKHFPEKPWFVLGLVFRGLQSEAEKTRVVDRLAASFPWQGAVARLDMQTFSLLRFRLWRAGGLVYRLH